MKVRTRLAVALLVCALLPVGAVAVLARPVLAGAFLRWQISQRDAVADGVVESVRVRSDLIARGLGRFCDRDPALDRAFALAAGTPGGLRDDALAALREAREALALDGLSVLRADGTVLLASGTPVHGARDSTAADEALRAPPGRALLRVRAGTEADAPGTLAGFCAARRVGAVLVVVGTVPLDARALAATNHPSVNVRIAVTDTGAPPAGSDRAVRPLALAGEEGASAAVIVTSRDDSRRGALADLERLLALAAIGAAAFAIILALLLSTPLARPIQAVTDAADRIAHGTRSVRIGNTTAAGEAGRLVRAFNEMARELESAEARLRRVERVAAWRDIARQMAHEIKNPLTPIQMAVEMLRKARERQLSDFDALFDEQTRIVLEEVARLRKLVENFSRFARAPKPTVETLSVTDVVAHVVGLHAAAGGAEVTGEAEERLPTIRADREQITQVLVNLVGNACLAAEDRARSAPDQGPAAVHVSARNLGDGRVAIDVDDNGAGIDPAVMDRLFEPYVTTRQGRGGTGLGLAIAFRIVTDHGGTITADSTSEGTRFEVILPVAGPSAKDITLDSEDKKLPSIGTR